MTDEVELPCALIPVHGRQLLVPGVSVAEVVRMQRIRPVKGLPDWHLGLLPWRGLVLPVLSVERVLADVGETIPGPRANNALLVMNRTRTLPGLGFYAVLVRGLPRMLWVTAEDLEDVDGPLAAGEASRVRVGQDEAVIPRLAYLEELAIQHGKTVRVPPELRPPGAPEPNAGQEPATVLPWRPPDVRR